MTEQTFKVGDEVIVVNSYDRYSITKDGSYGVILEVYEDNEDYYISFYHMTGLLDNHKRYYIQKRYLAPYQPKPIKEQVIDKIKALENNFKQKGKQNEMSML